MVVADQQTFFFNTFLVHIRSQEHIALTLSSSGIATLLLDDGHTAHSMPKIPIKVNETCRINRGTASAELIKKTVDPKLKQVPFGGNLIIFSGDFQQMLPVVRQGNSKQLFHNV